MKKLLLSLMVLATLASCGKDNNVSTNGSYTDPLTNPNFSSGNNYYAHKALTDAKMAIDNHATYFGTMWVMNSTASNANCKQKWFGTWCTYSSSSGSTGSGSTFNNYVAAHPGLAYIYSDGSYVVHANVDINAKKNELSNLFANATQLDYVDYADGRIFRLTSGGHSYQIDTRYPIQANPTVAGGRSLYNIQ